MRSSLHHRGDGRRHGNRLGSDRRRAGQGGRSPHHRRGAGPSPGHGRGPPSDSVAAAGKRLYRGIQGDDRQHHRRPQAHFGGDQGGHGVHQPQGQPGGQNQVRPGLRRHFGSQDSHH